MDKVFTGKGTKFEDFKPEIWRQALSVAIDEECLTYIGSPEDLKLIASSQMKTFSQEIQILELDQAI